MPQIESLMEEKKNQESQSTYPSLLGNLIEKFSVLGVLNDHENVTGSVDELEMLYDVGVVEDAEHFDFPLHFFKYALVLDFLLVHYLNSHFVSAHFVVRDYTQQSDPTQFERKEAYA